MFAPSTKIPVTPAGETEDDKRFFRKVFRKFPALDARKPTETDLQFVIRVLRYVPKMTDEQWGDLSEEEQRWFALNVNLILSDSQQALLKWPSGALVIPPRPADIRQRNKVVQQTLHPRQVQSDYADRPGAGVKPTRFNTSDEPTPGHLARLCLVDDEDLKYRTVRDLLNGMGVKPVTRSMFRVIRYEFRQTLKALRAKGVIRKRGD